MAINKYDRHSSSITEDELQKSRELLREIENLILNTEVSQNDSLDFENIDNFMSEYNRNDSDQLPNQFSLHQMENIVTFFDSRKQNKFQQTKYRYPFLKYPSYISKFRKYISEMGLKFEKHKLIKNANKI